MQGCDGYHPCLNFFASFFFQEKKEEVIVGETKLFSMFRTPMGATHGFRQRCKIGLLKSEGYTAKEIAVIVSSNMASVYNWLNRYHRDGITGLCTKPGQGRKPIGEEEHVSIVRG